jgi:dihydrofolate synthase / folylpolyglutamate synthase
MALSDAILTRLLSLHPKIIDLSLGRMEALLAKMGHPERHLPPVIHVAGTNGKGSTVAYLRAVMEAAGLSVHAYTSPHLVKFHERIRLAGELIPEADLTALLEECEAANGGEPITFFEITTVAAFLAFSRKPADYLLLEVGLGGRLDATNVIPQTAISVITPIDYDHQQYLGDTLTAIAGEKAGIIKKETPVIIGYQADEARDAIIRQAQRMKAPALVGGEDWQAYEEQGRLIFSDENGLLDLPLPQLPGRFQIQNAGKAIAAIRRLADPRITDAHIAEGLKSVTWAARMQRLGQGHLSKLLPEGAELWLDGGHNPAGGKALAEAFAELEDRNPKPLTIIWGMLNTKEAAGYIRPFAGLARHVITIAIPGEENAIPAENLAATVIAEGLPAETASSIEDALRRAAQKGENARVLIGGSLYLAGRVLALHSGEKPSEVTGAARR